MGLHLNMIIMLKVTTPNQLIKPTLSHKKHDLWFKPNINIELIDDIITTVDVNIEVNKGDYTFIFPPQ